ncbi:hypothetical protein [Spongiimicrobium salis]|uniref:hypothetical protein n=1 Tax=Spongiimicrobium salis TaxID=1667022 RepID=UPI00374D044B
MEYIQCRITKEILLAVVHNNKGYLKVTNMGPQWAAIQQGEYYLMDLSGKLKNPRKTKRALETIFTGLINKHLCFEYNGVLYTWGNGKWNQTPVGFKWPVEIDA